MNMFKKNGGFTLVELIVVIAILAILAGVAVPAYSGYIEKAQEASDSTALSAVKTAVMAAYATEGTVTEIVFTEGSGVTSVKVDDADPETALADTDFATYYGDEITELELKTGSTATWKAVESAEGANDDGWDISGE